MDQTETWEEFEESLYYILQPIGNESEQEARQRFDRWVYRNLWGRKTARFVDIGKLMRSIHRTLRTKRNEEIETAKQQLREEMKYLQDIQSAGESREQITNQENAVSRAQQEREDVEHRNERLESVAFNNSVFSGDALRAFTQHEIQKNQKSEIREVIREELDPLKQSIWSLENEVMKQRNLSVVVGKQFNFPLTLIKPSGPDNEEWNMEDARQSLNGAPAGTDPLRYLSRFSVFDLVRGKTDLINRICIFYGLVNHSHEFEEEFRDRNIQAIIATLSGLSVDYVNSILEKP
eukprot:gb/GECH01000031.1/.p1 GENE.gb/GECH01000031.1/~~gb/GECH01000031.1/.p1  ORF type:complete len:292 (+),score=30.21 gb/GECH01000031.1/:1-876(+)